MAITLDELLQGYRDHLEADREILAQLESGKMSTREAIGGEPWRDTTEETKARWKKRIAEMEALIAKASAPFEDD